MKDSDHGYKLLFSHPEMVEDLLRGYVDEEWVSRLDFSTLEKVSGSYVSDDFREREDDAVWRVRFAGDEWLYVYLLLEFQSKIDRFMALRVMTYLGLLYQDVVRAKGLTASKRLPPVLPVVLYNGARRWTAKTDVGELVEPIGGGLERYRPSLAYLLLDEGDLMSRGEETTRNLVTALFKLEKSRNKDDILKVVGSLARWLARPDRSELRRAFSEWMAREMGPAGGTLELELDAPEETRDMLSKTMEKWRREAREEGLETGMVKGREEGLLAGYSEMIMGMLEARFGDVPPGARERVMAADRNALLEMGRRLASSNTIEEVIFDR